MPISKIKEDKDLTAYGPEAFGEHQGPPGERVREEQSALTAWEDLIRAQFYSNLMMIGPRSRRELLEEVKQDEKETITTAKPKEKDEDDLVEREKVDKKTTASTSRIG
ncbi:unnamed protein product, partial [Amoebophrya sp. A25]|eukprot:GSA25T00010261001.1